MAALTVLLVAILISETAGRSNLTNQLIADVYWTTIILTGAVASYTYTLPTRNNEFATLAAITIDFGSYDFIVVGGGAAGSVVAARLSEVPRWNILLLEAGGEETEFAQVPAMCHLVQFSDLNWGYTTTPQKSSCLGMNNKQCHYPRGKVLGGSSTTNAMIYVRGNPADYDLWESMGNPGWSFDDIFPYFIKTEDYTISQGDAGYYGSDGPWTVAHSQPPLPTDDIFMAANKELGQNYIDYNGKGQIGVAYLQKNIKNGRRISLNHAVLSGARNRPNLHVITRALVTKILFAEDGVTATGVEFTLNNLNFSATAKKEVIVSAGSVNTPQLLMLSGIGPRGHLEELGIKLRADLPVGQNLKEHSLFLGPSFNTNYSVPDANPLKDLNDFADGLGFYTVCGGMNAVGFALNKTNDGVPEIEYLYIPQSGQHFFSPSFVKQFNINPEIASTYFGKVNPNTDFSFLVILLHPRSTGRITLKSRDPLDFPNIDLNFFSDPDGEDIETVYQGILFLRELANTPSYQKIGAKLLDYGPLCRKHEKDSRGYWYCVIRQLSTHLYHPIRTCRMGNDTATSVVNSHLKVHGFNNLRVVDASIIPETISGHTCAPTVAIAEKICDEIKSDYGASL